MKTLKRLFRIKAFSLPLCVLVILIFATFFMGGSSRADVGSLMILRPLSVVALGSAIWTLRKKQFENHKSLISLIIAFVFLHVAYLLPDSQELAFDKFQYQSMIRDNNQQNGSLFVASYASMQNSLSSLILPISVILLALQITIDEQIIVFKVLLLLACLSGVIGVLQILGNANSFLYLYNISNFGSATGFFANRNHQAVFLGMLFPMFATYASLKSRTSGTVIFRNWVAILCSSVLVPLIMITGSRAGLLIGLIAFTIALVIYGSQRSSNEKSWKWKILGIFAGSAGLGLMTVGMSRAEAWDRLFGGDEFADGRAVFWSLAGDLIGRYFPLGTGPGGFSAAFATIEPIEVLDSTYLNHAHNDWLEWVVTFGLPGFILLVAALGLFLLTVVQKWKDPEESANSRFLLKLGIIIIALIAVASIGDYPLRTPIISCVFALALCWAMGKGINKNPV